MDEKSINENIEKKILEINNIIENNYKNIKIVNDDVTQIYNSIKTIVEDVESGDNEMVEFLKYLKFKFHTSRGNYYMLSGNEIEAKKDFNRADKNKEAQNYMKSSVEPFIETILETRNEEIKIEINSVQMESFEKLKIYFKENHNNLTDNVEKLIEFLIKELQILYKIPKSISEYFSYPCKEINVLLSELETTISDSVGDKISNPIFKIFQELYESFMTKEYERKIEFMEQIVELAKSTKTISESKDRI